MAALRPTEPIQLIYGRVRIGAKPVGADLAGLRDRARDGIGIDRKNAEIAC
jgi:hypothetical protein